MKKQKKYYTFFDAFIINIFTFLAVLLLWAIIDSVDLFNPLDEFFDNFDYTDLYYSELRHNDMVPDTNIFIVNIGTLSRAELAKQITVLQKFQPKVIGIDAVFAEQKGMEDYLLKQALNLDNNIVLGGFGEFDEDDEDEAIGIIKSNPFFGEFPVGHLEFIADPKIVREFDKFIRFNDTIINAFSLEIMSKYDPNVFLEFAQRKSKTEIINYRAGYHPYIIFDYEEISDTNSNLEIIKDKIVLMGYVRMHQGAPTDTIDSHFTPIKRSEYGYADTKGIEIHAHILSMLLSKDYVQKVPDWINYLIALIICQLFLMWLVYYYVHGAKLFDILSKPIQFLLIVLVLWATFMIFAKFGIKIDMIPSVLTLVLCIEVLYLYEETLELFKIDSYLTQNFKYTRDERIENFRYIVRLEFIRNRFKRTRKRV